MKVAKNATKNYNLAFAVIAKKKQKNSCSGYVNWRLRTAQAAALCMFSTRLFKGL